MASAAADFPVWADPFARCPARFARRERGGESRDGLDADTPAGHSVQFFLKRGWAAADRHRVPVSLHPIYLPPRGSEVTA